jgi:hypothetical protein
VVNFARRLKLWTLVFSFYERNDNSDGDPTKETLEEGE